MIQLCFEYIRGMDSLSRLTQVMNLQSSEAPPPPPLSLFCLRSKKGSVRSKASEVTPAGVLKGGFNSIRMRDENCFATLPGEINKFTLLGISRS